MWYSIRLKVIFDIISYIELQESATSWRISIKGPHQLNIKQLASQWYITNSCKRKMNFCYILLIAGGCAFISNVQAQDTVTAIKGEPLILNFQYHGPRVGYEYTKDGNNFQVDRQRTFQRHGKIFFTRVLPSDSGAYRLRIGRFDKTITVNGKYLHI